MRGLGTLGRNKLRVQQTNPHYLEMAVRMVCLYVCLWLCSGDCCWHIWLIIHLTFLIKLLLADALSCRLRYMVVQKNCDVG